MKLQQGQVWKQGDTYYRIVVWARLSIDYKEMTSPTSGEGTHHQVTKKEFCRLIKDATLLTPNELAVQAHIRAMKPAAPPKRRRR